jgi:hypothetical protein
MVGRERGESFRALRGGSQEMPGGHFFTREACPFRASSRMERVIPPRSLRFQFSVFSTVIVIEGLVDFVRCGI